MTDEQIRAQRAPFEQAMTCCATDSGTEPSFIRNGDDSYVQREMQAAFQGWLEAHARLEAVLTDMASAEIARNPDGSDKQSGFLQAIDGLAAELGIARDVRGSAALDDGSRAPMRVSEADEPHVGVPSITGELVKISSASTLLGSSVSIKADGRTVHIEGLPETTARACRSLLFERVELHIRPEANWIPAERAAFESAVELQTLRGWVQGGFVASRLDDGVLMVEATSLRTYVHRYWKGRTASAANRSGS